MKQRTYIPHLGLQCGLVISTEDENTSSSAFGIAAHFGRSNSITVIAFSGIKDRTSPVSPVEPGGGLVLFQDNMNVGTYA